MNITHAIFTLLHILLSESCFCFCFNISFLIYCVYVSFLPFDPFEKRADENNTHCSPSSPTWVLGSGEGVLQTTLKPNAFAPTPFHRGGKCVRSHTPNVIIILNGEGSYPSFAFPRFLIPYACLIILKFTITYLK